MFLGAFPVAVLALLGWQLGHGIALQPWPSTLLIKIGISASLKLSQNAPFDSHFAHVYHPHYTLQAKDAVYR